MLLTNFFLLDCGGDGPVVVFHPDDHGSIAFDRNLLGQGLKHNF